MAHCRKSARRRGQNLNQAAVSRTTCLGWTVYGVSITFELLCVRRMRYLTSRPIDTQFIFSHGAENTSIVWKRLISKSLVCCTAHLSRIAAKFAR